MGARNLILLMLLAAGCRGPRPEVRDVHVSPAPEPGRYRVEATVENRGGGEGDVVMILRLRDGDRVVQERTQLELKPHETSHLVKDVEAPAGSWTAHIAAQYPPE